MDPYYSDEFVTIYNGDCLDVMAGFDQQFDLVFTSPPYNLGGSSSKSRGFQNARKNPAAPRSVAMWTAAASGLANGYEDHADSMPIEEYTEWQQSVLRQLWELLAENGSIFYNHKPRISGKRLWTPLELIPEECNLHQIIIWARAGGLNYQPDAYVPTHEWVCLLTKPHFRLRSQGASGVGDVWRVPQESGTKHPAPFPVALPARAIETCAPTLVLDPFMGSGTTLVAAKMAGVRAVGIELSETYCEMAVRRLQSVTPSLFSGSSPVPQQADLFGGGS